MPSSEKGSFKDYIEYKPEFVLYVTKNQMKVIEKYYPIIQALRGKHKTVKEIHDLYFDKELKKHKYSIKTIYRYLDELEKESLVVVSGHRVTKGSRVLEKLYTRTATIFNMLMDEEYTKHKKKYYSELADKMVMVMKSIYEKPTLDSSKLKETFLDIFLTTKMNHEQIMEKVKTNTELVELYGIMDIDSINALDGNVALFMTLLGKPEIFDSLKELLL